MFILLQRNGGPFGRGFTGIQLEKRDDRFGVYLGNIGARPRSWWRGYARRNGFKLIEVGA